VPVEAVEEPPRLIAVPEPVVTPDPESALMANVIALANQKGGVAKTTTTLNLGVALRERGNRVLVIDPRSAGQPDHEPGHEP
jgi:chromosome partitioning protein